MIKVILVDLKATGQPPSATPEAPAVLPLPISGSLRFGAGVLVYRRRQKRNSTADANIGVSHLV